MVKKLLLGREKLPLYVLLLIFAVVCGFSVWNDSLTYDEKGHISFGKKVEKSFLERFEAYGQ